MSTPLPWAVTNPSPISQLTENLWCVTDEIPGIRGTNRRMTIVKRADGGLLFYNAIPLREEQMAEIGALGTPAQLFVPHHLHCLHAHAFSTRLHLAVFAPDAGLAMVRASMPAALAHSALPGDPTIAVHTVDGLKTGEGVMLVRSASGTSLLVADLVTNAPHIGDLSGLLMRVVGFTASRPIMPRPVRMRVGKDMKQVKRLLEELATTPGLMRLIPSHGDILSMGAPEALRTIAGGL